MKNKILITIILSIAINTLHAQFYLEFNSGYAKGVNNKKAFDNENSYTNKDYYNLDTSNYSQYNLAEGIFIEPRVGYKINNWLSTSVGFYYLISNNETNMYYENQTEYIELEFHTDPLATFSHSYYKENYSIKSQFVFNPEFSLNKKLNSFNVNINIGASISKSTIHYTLDSSRTSYQTMGNPNGHWSIKYAFIDRYKYLMTSNFKISARIGLSVSYNLSKNLLIISKIYYNDLIIKPTEREQYYHYKSKEQTQETTPDKTNNRGSLDEIIIDETKKSEHIKGDTFGMNTLQFSFGIRYTFNKKDKTDK